MVFYKSSMGRYFVLFAIIPAILIGAIITYVSSVMLYKVKVNDTKDMLRGVAKELVYTYELVSTEDSGLRKVNGQVYAGDVRVSGDYSVVDRIKGFTGAEISLFYMDTRVVTTILDKNGYRIVGTKATDIWNKYIQFGNEYFDEAVIINGKEYFGYYIPVHSTDHIILGMGFAGIPSNDIRATINDMTNTSMILCVVFSCVAIFLCIIVSSHLLKVQNKIIDYVIEMDDGNFEHEMDKKLYNRKDEFGMMANYMVKLNTSLKNLVHKDTLTGLYNRRAAMRFLDGYIREANSVGGETFTLIIGDIDFFKKVNDTYGHNCGDAVLKMVAEHFGKIPEEEGFAARWGGEEFLIAYKGKLQDAVEKLEALAKSIRETTVSFEEHRVNITMTFGAIQYRAPESIDVTISNADRFLYKGKESGRNCIIS